MTLSRSGDTRLGALVAILLLAVNVASVSSRLGFLHKAKEVKEYDHWRYIEMSRGAHGKPDLQREPPYCFRLAVPFLAGALTRGGLPENAAFFALTNASLFGLLFVLWLHLRDLGFSRPLRLTGLLLTGLTQGAVRWFEYQYWMTDPAALLLVMLAFLAVERGRTAALGAVSVVAAFVRETYVLVYPYVFLHDLRARLERAAGAADRRQLLAQASRSAVRTVALAALPVALMVAIRRSIVPNQPDSFVDGIVDSMAFRWAHVFDNQPYVVSVGAFGVLVPLLLLYPSLLPRMALRHFDRALYVLAVYATLAISNNNERPLAYALPALVPAALWCLRRFLEETRLRPWPVLGAAIALQLAFWAGQEFVGSGTSIYQPVNWLTVALMAGAWVAARVLLRRRRSFSSP